MAAGRLDVVTTLACVLGQPGSRIGRCVVLDEVRSTRVVKLKLASKKITISQARCQACCYTHCRFHIIRVTQQLREPDARWPP